MKVLNIGCGNMKLIQQTTLYHGWEEVRADSYENKTADIMSDIRDLKEFENESFDSVWANHVIEHNYWHDLPNVFNSMMRVLKKDGFIIIHTPDIASIAHLIPDKLTEPLYISHDGPVAPIDMLYGFRPEIEENPGMLHKVCFTQKSLIKLLDKLDIKSFVIAGRNYELTAFLFKDKIPYEIMEKYGVIIEAT